MFTEAAANDRSFEPGTVRTPVTCSSRIIVSGIDGVPLNVRQWGEGTPRYFLIHGFGEGSFTWDSFATELAAEAAVGAIDLRGHGDSGKDPDGNYAPERYVEDVTCALETEDLTDVVLIGHSLGAAVAMQAAVKCAHRVRGLILVEGGPYLRPAGLQRIREEFAKQPWCYHTVQQYATRLVTKLPLARPSLLKDLAPHALRRNAQGAWELKVDRALRACRVLIDDESLLRILPKISCPVLLVRGGASTMLSRASAEKLAAELPDARLCSVRRAGHAVMFDNPEAFLATVRPFLSGLQ
jgi:pimeloyl-ACP methyl ester carboxylesterase